MHMINLNLQLASSVMLPCYSLKDYCLSSSKWKNYNSQSSAVADRSLGFRLLGKIEAEIGPGAAMRVCVHGPSVTAAGEGSQPYAPPSSEELAFTLQFKKAASFVFHVLK